MNARPTSRLGLNRRVVGLLVGAILATIACGPGAGSSSAPNALLNVVATTTVFADIVKNVGGERVSVTSIIPAGVGPEDYEPKPDDAKKLTNANLIVSGGVGLDDFLEQLTTAAGGQAAARLVLGDGIPTITVDGEANPHFWLDPNLVVEYYLPKISAELSRLDPAGEAGYAANARAYGVEIQSMDMANKQQVDTLPAANRKLVTFHDAFPYFAKHYGFEVVGVIIANVGQEPTAADLAALVEKVRSAHVKAVFSEAQFSPELAKTLADEAGVTKVVTTLYNDSLGASPVDTYLKMMKWNVDEVVKALG